MPSFGCCNDGEAWFQICDLGSSCCERSVWDWGTKWTGSVERSTQHPKMKICVSLFFFFFTHIAIYFLQGFAVRGKAIKKKKNAQKTKPALVDDKVGRKGKRTVLLGNTLDEVHQFRCVYEEPLVAPMMTQILKAGQTKAARSVCFHTATPHPFFLLLFELFVESWRKDCWNIAFKPLSESGEPECLISFSISSQWQIS